MGDVDAGGREITGEVGALHSHISKLEQISHNLPEHKSADDELDKAWLEWEATFDAIKDSVILTDNEFRILQANPAASQLFGKPLDQIIGKTCWQLVHGTNHPPKECPLKKAKNTKKHEEIELYLCEKGVWVADSVDPVFDQQGSVTGTVHIIRDITDRKQAEQLLRKERDRAQQYLDVAGVMFVAIDAEQRVGLINKKGCQILGCKEEEVVAKNWFDNFLPEKNREEVRAVFEKLFRGEVEALEYYENPILTKNGDQRLIAWHNTVLRDAQGHIIAVLSSGEDITDRKKAEQKLLENQAQLKSLASQLTLAEERERRRLATELHDRISQAMVISKIRLEAIRKSGRSRKLDKALEEVCNSIGQTIQDTRTLTLDLGNPVLYELGFETAVSEWLTDQIQKKHGLTVEFEDDGEDKPLDDDVRVLLFRDVRELLINVVKHAGAHKVKVSVRKLDNHICVTVEDDGVGFDPVEVVSMAARKGEFGLFSIRERLEDLDGHIEIDSTPGRGCKVTITAPLKQKEMTQ